MSLPPAHVFRFSQYTAARPETLPTRRLQSCCRCFYRGTLSSVFDLLVYLTWLQALKKSPASVAILDSRAATYAKLTQYDLALRDARHMIKKDKNDERVSVPHTIKRTLLIVTGISSLRQGAPLGWKARQSIGSVCVRAEDLAPEPSTAPDC